MAKETSVAPKERVNIVYRPATGEAKEEVELPLKLLVVGDFTLKTDDRRIEKREPIPIDKDNFNEVMKGQNLELDLVVPDKISENHGDDDEIALSLKIKGIKDFDPESIVRNNSELNKYIKLREALQSLKNPMSNRPEFRKKIQEIIKDPALTLKLRKELNLDKEE